MFFLLIGRSFALYIIAVNQEPPFSSCSTVFAGFETDMVREGLSLYGWRYNEDYIFECNSSSTNYSALLGRMVYDPYILANGYSYSYPTQNGNLGILVYSTTISTSKLVNIFSSNLWIIIPSGSLFVLIFLWIFEIPGSKDLSIFKKLKLLHWVSLSTVFFSEQTYNYRFPSKILIMSFLSFLTMMFSLYLAGCIFFTFQTIKLVDFPEKLQNMRYTTESSYLEYTSIYGGYYIDTGLTSSNINNILPLLTNGYLDAIVMEYNTLSNIAQTNCNFISSAKPFISYFYAVQILPHVNSELKSAIDFGLSALSKEFDVQGLKNIYFNSNSTCNSNVNSVTSISLYMFIEIFLAYFLVVILVFLLRWFCSKRDLAKERNKHIKEIRTLIGRPESKILKITQNQIRQFDSQCQSIFKELENNIKHSNFIQEKLMNNIRTKDARFR